MFDKILSFEIDGYELYSDLVSEDVKRIFVDNSGVVTVIKNNESNFFFSEYTKGELTRQDIVSNNYGVLAGQHSYNGERWLEFYDHLAAYDEEYSIVKLKGDDPVTVVSLTRESYQHSQKYHRLFIESDGMYLFIIRHNRLHVYKIGDLVEDIDILEGGNWFICGSHLVSINGRSIELYDFGLNLNAIFDNDLDVDEILYSENETKGSIAIALNDHSQESSSIIYYHDDSKTFGMKACEFLVHDMGISSDRLWINPRLTDPEADMGGYMILDRYAYPLFSHTKTKGISSIGIGGVPSPLFHRSEGIFPLKDGATMIVDAKRLIIVDYSCRAVQEIFYTDLRFFAISPDGGHMVIMNIDKKLIDSGYSQGGVGKSELPAVTVDCYSWNPAQNDGKVINMNSFKR